MKIKILKIVGIVIFSLLFLMYILPILFPDRITNGIKNFANDKLESELNFTEANLSFFNHFPSLTLQLTDFSLNGSAPFNNEPLVKAKEIAFGINIYSLIFKSTITIDKIYVSNADITIKVDKNGEANYNVYKSDTTKVTNNSDEASLHLQSIIISNSHLVYEDQSLKMLINANGFNYTGKGELDKAIFDLYTKAKIDKLNFTFENEKYLINKKVEAELITKINTNSLSFVFQENDLKINKLPLRFTGKFDFLKDGYNIDFEVNSINSNLDEFFSAFPPQYIKWLEKTKVSGKTDLSLTLKGQHLVAKNSNPDLAFNMKIRNGAIDYNNSPVPVTNLFLNFDTKLPSLDPEKLEVNIDSMLFNVGKDYIKAIVKSKGLSNPKLNADIKANIDLQKMNRAFGFQNFDIKGMLAADIIANGEYNKSKRAYPITKGEIVLNNGFIKTDYYPNPIENINIKAKVLNSNGTAKAMNVEIDKASFSFEDNPFTLNVSLQNLDDILYNIKAKGVLDVGKIYKVFHQKGLDLNGFIKADLAFQGKQSDVTKGKYKNLNNKGTLELRNIKVNSDYFPKPFIINEGLFTFNQDKMEFKNFKASYGKSDFVMDGNLQNVINFALTDTEILKGNFTINSNYINVDEFMTEVTPSNNSVGKESDENTQSEKGVVMIPKNLNLNLIANVNKVDFDSLTITKLRGNLLINKGQLQLINSGFNIIGCNVTSTISYADESSKQANFEFKINANEFDVKRAYTEVKMFREMASSAENAEGIVSVDYSINGKLDENMEPIYPSLFGGGTLSVKNVKLNGYKMFNAVSEKTDNEEFKNPDVTEVKIKSSVKNNIITIKKFKFKFAGFRPKIEGTSSFDGKINFKMRLGLPPLGVIGIPMTITGTQENPIIKMGKKTEDLEEVKFQEEQLKLQEPQQITQ